MPLPTDSRTINDVVSATLVEVRPDLYDGTFNSNSLLARLYNKEKVLLDGGDQVRTNLVYDKLPGDWYTGLGPFSTATKETWTQLVFDWKTIYAEITLPGIDLFKNSGPHKQFDLIAGKLTVARMTIADKVGTALFNDGTNSAAPIGLRQAINTTGSYGGVTRGTDALGTAVKGNVDTTGGSITVPFINNLQGTASAGGAQKCDLLMTTQVLYDAVWARTQPQQRFSAKDGPSWDLGADYININGAGLTADSHVPTGYCFGINTDFAEFWVGQGYDFYFRGPYPFPDQDGFTGQVIFYCALALPSPRMHFSASGLTA